MAPRPGASRQPPATGPIHAMSARLNESEYGQLESIAKEFGISMNQALHMAIKGFFQNLIK